jgi:hypothetical protein
MQHILHLQKTSYRIPLVCRMSLVIEILLQSYEIVFYYQPDTEFWGEFIEDLNTHVMDSLLVFSHPY